MRIIDSEVCERVYVMWVPAREGEWSMQFRSDCVQSIKHSVLECVGGYCGFSSVKNS